MKKIILILFILSLSVHAQTIYYGYDDAGNLEKRSVIPINGKIPDIDDDGNIKPFKDALLTHDISIFPNPTKGELKVEITNLNSDISAMIEILE